MNSQEFKTAWLKSDIDVLNAFTKNQLEGTQLKQETKEFLMNPGLPDSAAPFLSFDENKGSKIKSIDEVIELDHSFKIFLHIGNNNYGDPICIDTSNNDKIVFLNHDNDFQSHFVNSSIEKLASFLVVYRNFIEKIQALRGEDAFFEGNFTDEEFSELESELIRIDEPALDEGALWNEDLGLLLSNRGSK